MGVYQRQGDQTPGRESQASKGVEEELWWGVGLLGLLTGEPRLWEEDGVWIRGDSGGEGFV